MNIYCFLAQLQIPILEKGTYQLYNILDSEKNDEYIDFINIYIFCVCIHDNWAINKCFGFQLNVVSKSNLNLVWDVWVTLKLPSKFRQVTYFYSNCLQVFFQVIQVHPNGLIKLPPISYLEYKIDSCTLDYYIDFRFIQKYYFLDVQYFLG